MDAEIYQEIIDKYEHIENQITARRFAIDKLNQKIDELRTEQMSLIIRIKNLVAEEKDHKEV